MRKEEEVLLVGEKKMTVPSFPSLYTSWRQRRLARQFDIELLHAPFLTRWEGKGGRASLSSQSGRPGVKMQARRAPTRRPPTLTTPFLFDAPLPSSCSVARQGEEAGKRAAKTRKIRCARRERWCMGGCHCCCEALGACGLQAAAEAKGASNCRRLREADRRLFVAAAGREGKRS